MSGQLERRHLLRLEAAREDERKAPTVHINPYDHRQKHGRNERLKDDCLVHASCLSDCARRKCHITMSLSGRLMPHAKRRERKIVSRSRRYLISSHGRSKRWLGDRTTTPLTV